MYICICQSINEKRIIEELKKNKSKEQIIEDCKIGLDCGKCKLYFDKKYEELILKIKIN